MASLPPHGPLQGFPVHQAPVNGTPKPRAIDRVRRAYHSVQRQRLPVPEWAGEDGAPLEVFFAPLSSSDLARIQAREGTKERSVQEQQVDLLAFHFQSMNEAALHHEDASGFCA